MNNTDTTPMQHQQNTLIPNGYKKTTIGVIPVEWEVKKLGDLGELKNGINKDKDQFGFGFPLINLNDVFEINTDHDKDFSLVNSNEKERRDYSLNIGDVLFVRSSVKATGVGLTCVILNNIKDAVYSGFIIRFRDNHYLDLHYKVHCFFEQGFRNRLLAKSTISANININQVALNSLQLPIPPILEQQKIAEILSTWDEAIANCKKTIKSIKSRNKGLAQQLLSGKKRLSGFSEKWDMKPLSSLLIYIPREVDKPNGLFLALGLRSHGKGVFHKPDFDPNAIAMTKLFEVKENDLVLNITFAWEQAIAIASKEDEGGLVSHRFPTYVFNPKTATHLYFKFFVLQSFFKSKLELISPGGAGRNRVMSKKDFLKLEVKVPNIVEQIAIAQVLETANQELKSYEDKLKALQLQKKGLMQQLLTGKLRVNVN
jgi:type I restriction enzyme S subunit